MTNASRKNTALRWGIWLFVCHLPIFPIQVTADDTTPWSQDVAPAFVLADSGVKEIVVGEGWSPWYRLGVGESPVGYSVSKVTFWLTGDRSCGNGAECREIERSDRRILWEFRVKGNIRRPSGKPVRSQGHIRVTYRHK